MKSHLAVFLLVSTLASAQIPASFFGLHFRTPAHPPSVSYGTCRIWGVAGTYWASIEPVRNVFEFAALDSALAVAYNAGIRDGCIFTFAMTPKWASPHPWDNTCDKLATPTGACWMPPDLALDGSGTNQIITDALTAIATHVNDPTYLLSHAHIQYWEPWNEINRGPRITAITCTTSNRCSYKGTYAQVVVIAETMRCILKGTGSVNGVPCTNAPIDPTAQILTPSGQVSFLQNGRRSVANFLNCSQFPPSHSKCITRTRGSDAIDVVNTHCYVKTNNADDVIGYIAQQRAILSPVDLAKPFMCNEGGWQKNTVTPDFDVQAGFIARWFADLYSAGVVQAGWYAWDDGGWGTLWFPYGKGGCLDLNGCITKAGIAYQQIYNWMLGATFGGCAVNANITTCTLTRDGGYSALMVWDNTTITNCVGQLSSETCGGTLYTVPDGYITKRDLDGISQPALPVELIGAKPLLLEAATVLLP